MKSARGTWDSVHFHSQVTSFRRESEVRDVESTHCCMQMLGSKRLPAQSKVLVGAGGSMGAGRQSQAMAECYGVERMGSDYSMPDVIAALLSRDWNKPIIGVATPL